MSNTEIVLEKSYRCFGGWVRFYRHLSKTCGTEMRFSVYEPPQIVENPVPVLYWLSGLTCTEENFMTKAGAQRYAAEHGLMLVAPDTSPRGLNLPGEDDDWDFGSGAGFYLNAVREPWSANYHMYDYVVEELPSIIQARYNVIPDRQSVSGHSMGGHGALVVALRNRERYRSVSAFSPICAPVSCAWGQKAFSNYLGEDRVLWQSYDATCLLAEMAHAPAILIDQGQDDDFLETQLKPELLQKVCVQKGHDLSLNMRDGYDHGYYFVASFIGEHIAYHAEKLKG